MDIQWLNLGVGYLLLAIPLAILFYHGTGLLSVAALSVVRMTVQLLFVGVYLKVIFELNSAWLNVGWILVMLVIAALTIDRRSNLRQKRFFLPVAAGLLCGLTVTEMVFLKIVLALKNPLDAWYLIPITGMILGNCLQSSIIGMRSFVDSLLKEENSRCWSLACGATPGEALLPFIREALKNAFSPALATMATMGLIALPGMMTGQILGGTDPMVAVKYQIMIMIAIFSGTVITVTVGISISKRMVFDKWGALKPDVIRQ